MAPYTEQSETRDGLIIKRGSGILYCGTSMVSKDPAGDLTIKEIDPESAFNMFLDLLPKVKRSSDQVTDSGLATRLEECAEMELDAWLAEWQMDNPDSQPFDLTFTAHERVELYILGDLEGIKPSNQEALNKAAELLLLSAKPRELAPEERDLFLEVARRLR